MIALGQTLAETFQPVMKIIITGLGTIRSFIAEYSTLIGGIISAAAVAGTAAGSVFAIQK